MPNSKRYIVYNERRVFEEDGLGVEALVKVDEFDTHAPEWRVMEDWANRNQPPAGRYWLRFHRVTWPTFECYDLKPRGDYDVTPFKPDDDEQKEEAGADVTTVA